MIKVFPWAIFPSSRKQIWVTVILAINFVGTIQMWGFFSIYYAFADSQFLGKAKAKEERVF